MLKSIFLSAILGAACVSLADGNEDFVRSLSVSEAGDSLRLASGTHSGAADYFAASGIFSPKVSEFLGNDLFETNMSASSQVFPEGLKAFSEDDIVPLGDGKVFVASLGAIVDEDKIASAGNWRMPVSKSMSLGVIAVVLLVGVIVRKKQIAQ